jgi:hypothetical protein
MTRQRFEVFTPKHGDVVLTTRFRFVARVVTRFVRTLDYDYPIPFVPVKPGARWQDRGRDEGPLPPHRLPREPLDSTRHSMRALLCSSLHDLLPRRSGV